MSVLSQSAPEATRLLAIDTAGAACSVALRVGDAVVASCLHEMVRGQAEALMPMMSGIMQEADVEFSSLHLIAVTVGPGSFTGLRTGLAAARGLSLALSIPLVGVTTTEAIALAASRDLAGRPITVVLESRRQDLYVQHFSNELLPLGEPYAELPEEIADKAYPEGVVFAGDAIGRIREIYEAKGDGPDCSFFAVTSPDAIFVADVAARRWSDGSGSSASFPTQLVYVRPPDAAQPANLGRLRR